jgi:hypothetical protein
MSATKHAMPDEQAFTEGFRKGWDKGWSGHESYILNKIMDRDPAIFEWLERMTRLAAFLRERDELALQQKQAAAQAIDDACNP